MNTQLIQPHLSHPPDLRSPITPVTDRVARTALIDRAAMRVGLWLVLWGSRPAADTDPRARHRRRAFRVEQRERHEAARERATRLWLHRS